MSRSVDNFIGVSNLRQESSGSKFVVGRLLDVRTYGNVHSHEHEQFCRSRVRIGCTSRRFGRENRQVLHEGELPQCFLPSELKCLLFFVLTSKCMQNLYLYEIFWSFGVFSVKVGILLLYWRIFPTRGLRIAVLAVGALTLGIFVANFFTFIFQCIPIARFWDQEIHGRCIEQHVFYLVSAIINVLSDIAVLVLPLPVVWRLHTSTSRKWSLSFLFLLGTL